ncbi:MAG TPA: proprotein convertase P-domain-containing protein, partial [Chitinophagaceae bacterium]|nr:proprotein convertase P-domain-containing protein [Chitinophagaceae bacterium]
MKRSLLFLFASVLFADGFAQTFSSTGTTAVANGGSEVCNNITVTGLATSINGTFGVNKVCINIASSCLKDIDVFLVAPDGTRIELTTDNGGSSDNYTNTCFMMNAAANGSISSGTNNAPYTGTYIPEGDLYKANNGQNPNGTWRLCVTDDKATGGGCTAGSTITSWTIDFGVPPPPVRSVQDCNGGIAVCQNTYSETNTYPGSGYVTPEVANLNNCLAEGEKNTVWYIFTVETGGNLGFQITPKSTDPIFDYDWALFNITTNGCNGITGNSGEGDPVSPMVSCSFSTAGGSTGTSAAGVGNTSDALGSNQNSLVPVTAGQTYALMVSNFTGGGNGYDLNFNAAGNTASVFDQTP